MRGRNIIVLKGILYSYCYLWYMIYCGDIAILKLKWKKEKSLIKHKEQTLVEWISICSISSFSVWCVGTAGVCRLWWWARCTRSAWWTRASRSSLPSRSESKTNTFCYVHVHISSGFILAWLQWANSSASPAGHWCTDGFRVRWQIRTSGNAEWLKGERPAAITTD